MKDDDIVSAQQMTAAIPKGVFEYECRYGTHEESCF